MQQEKKWVWKDKEISSIGDLMYALGSLTEAEAPEFRQMASEFGSVCLSNIGYCIGYFSDREKRDRLYQWLDVEHPIFGRRNPTPEEAFLEGVKRGKRLRSSAKE